jgi:hypothetical protein
MPIAIINIGGVRGEDAFFQELPMGQRGEAGVRVEFATEKILPELVEQLKRTGHAIPKEGYLSSAKGVSQTNSALFKDMLS